MVSGWWCKICGLVELPSSSKKEVWGEEEMTKFCDARFVVKSFTVRFEINQERGTRNQELKITK